MAFPRARGRVRLQFLNAISHGIEQLERRTLMAAGALDTSFAGSGKDSLAAPPSTTINVGLDPTPVGLAIGPDGKAIISANGLDPSGGKFVELIRLLPNGSRDVTFGSAGAVTLFNTTVTKVAILNDGRILIGGSILARLNNNGAFDSTFGGLGFGFRGVSTPVVTGMALQSDGHILLAGQSGQSAAVWRYNPDGTTDGSYGAGGVRPLVFVEEDNSLIATAAGGIALDPQGRVVAGVSVTGPGTDTGYGVARINTNGSIDTKFGTGGLTQIDDAAPAAPAVAVASTGTIYLAATQGIASATSHGLLMVMSADGKKFAVRTTGLVPTTSAALDVQVQADNKPIVVGWERDGGGNGNKKIIAQRFQAGSPTLPVAAALDRTFNSTGSIEVDYNAGGSSEKTFGFGDLGWSLRLSPNQKIFIAGTSVGASGSQFTVTRLLPDSATLNSFGTISGTTFFDPNGNGVLESPDVPISGIETFLDLNGNGTFDGGDVRAFGNIAGAYQFIGLKAGTYQVRQHAGGNIKTTIPDNGLRTVTLASGGSVGNVNFAISVAGSISGFIFEDLNGDGLGEINEPVLPGFDCYLDLNNNGVYDAASEPRTIAGADGIYAFGGLNAGTYVVRQATPAGWTLTGPPAQAWTITLAQNEHRNNVNFADRAIAPGAHLDADGTLVVVGSAADDNIVVNQQVALGAAAGTVFVTVDANQQQFTTPAVKRIYIDGRDGNDVITDSGTDFTAGADGGIGILSTLIGGNGNDTLRVTLNDTQSNRSASDFVDGGAGDDTLFNDSNGNITMHGGDGNDTLDNRPTSANAPSLFGDNGNDTILFFANAAATISGGNGFDVLATGTNIINGDTSLSLDGVANDGVVGRAPSNILGDVENFNFHAHGGNLTITGDDDANQINGSDDLNVVVNALGGDDIVNVNAGNITINGGDGNDTLDGSGANIAFSGGNGIDLLDMSGRQDSLRIFLDNAQPSGALGQVFHFDGTVEQANGGSGDDIIAGTAGNNTLVGNAGNDTLITRGGSDALFGGDGADTFQAKDGALTNIDGGNGVDQAQTDLADVVVNVEVVTH